MNSTNRACRHCRRNDTRWRRRGLCAKCYGVRGIRRQHQPCCKGGPAISTGRDYYDAPHPAPGPVGGRPKSAERIAELAERYRARQCFWPEGGEAVSLDGTVRLTRQMLAG